MKSYYFFKLFILIVTVSSCCSVANEGRGPEEHIFNITHYNITIAADLSNRLDDKLYPKAVSDTAIVNLIVDNIPRILTDQRKMNQKDQFRVDFINKQHIQLFKAKTENLLIDFKSFDTQTQRIEFLRNEFQGRAILFKNEFRRINEEARVQPYGSDIWTYLNQGVDNTIVDTSKSETFFDENRFINRQKNVLILLTDGYIEAEVYGKGYDLRGEKVNQFRQEFIKSGRRDLSQFYKEHPEYHIKAVENPLLKDLEILVLEIYDRSEGKTGAIIHPTDYEILRVFWNDWLNRSGVKVKLLQPVFSDRAEAERVVMKFLGV